MTCTPARETLPDRRAMYEIEKEAAVEDTLPKHDLNADPAACPRCLHDRAQDAASAPAEPHSEPEADTGPGDADGYAASRVDDLAIRFGALDRALGFHVHETLGLRSSHIIETAAAFEAYLRGGVK